jgi:hypothetical protein
MKILILFLNHDFKNLQNTILLKLNEYVGKSLVLPSLDPKFYFEFSYFHFFKNFKCIMGLIYMYILINNATLKYVVFLSNLYLVQCRG